MSFFARSLLTAASVVVWLPNALGTILEEWAAGADTFRAYPGGTWNMGEAEIWTEDRDTRRAWTDNADTLRVTMQENAWAAATITVDASLGSLGCSGVEILGLSPQWSGVKFTGDAFAIGSNGVNDCMCSANSYLQFDSPIVLGASQVWRNRRPSTNNSSGSIKMFGGVTSATGQTVDWTLDGCGYLDPGFLGSSEKHLGFEINNAISVNGTISVKNGASLTLRYSDDSHLPVLESPYPENQSLLLEGGAVFVINKPSKPIKTGLVSVGPGYSSIRGYNSGNSFEIGTLSRVGIGGTIDFPVSWNGGLTAYLTGDAALPDAGGWAVFNRTSLATVGTEGAIKQVSEKEDNANKLAAGKYMRVKTPAVVAEGSEFTPAMVRFTAGERFDYTGATITLSSGALISSADGVEFVGGIVKSGYQTGELFAYAFNDFIFSGTFADNGSVPMTLVKGGTGVLTLSGKQDYTGCTYLNGGTLKLMDGADMPNGIIQAGATCLELAAGGFLSVESELFLGGNLAIDEGATIAILLQQDGGIVLSNEKAELNCGGEECGANLVLAFPKGVKPAVGVYPLIRWDSDMVQELDVGKFNILGPKGCSGKLVVSEGMLAYEVDSLNGLTIVIR